MVTNKFAHNSRTASRLRVCLGLRFGVLGSTLCCYSSSRCSRGLGLRVWGSTVCRVKLRWLCIICAMGQSLNSWTFQCEHDLYFTVRGWQMITGIWVWSYTNQGWSGRLPFWGSSLLDWRSWSWNPQHSTFTTRVSDCDTPRVLNKLFRRGWLLGNDPGGRLVSECCVFIFF